VETGLIPVPTVGADTFHWDSNWIQKMFAEQYCSEETQIRQKEVLQYALMTEQRCSREK
jgi:hypothetical protein